MEAQDLHLIYVRVYDMTWALVSNLRTDDEDAHKIAESMVKLTHECAFRLKTRIHCDMLAEELRRRSVARARAHSKPEELVPSSAA